MSLFGEETPHAPGMGGHQSADAETTVWLTPPWLLDRLGAFDLDPCACSAPRPWPTAKRHYTREDNGLILGWDGRVWLNPPYGGPSVVGPWMRRMAAHNHGLALIFARTETDVFFETVWAAASRLLFIKSRLFFHRRDGSPALHNAGAPSVLVAYGEEDARLLDACGVEGALVTPGRVFAP